MITSTYAPSPVDDPPNYPFLWQSDTSGYVYLRLEPSDAGSIMKNDLRLYSAGKGCAAAGELVRTGVSNAGAWHNRLARGATVHLSNG